MHVVSRSRHACSVGRQPARTEESELHHLPQHPLGKGSPTLEGAEPVPPFCSTCHRNVINRTFRVNHMPVREGALLCSSCHNVHGTQNVRLLRAGTTIDESCTSCQPRESVGPICGSTLPSARAVSHATIRMGGEQRSDAGEQAAVPLPAVPRDVAPSADRL